MKTLLNVALTLVGALIISQAVHAEGKLEKDVQVGFNDAYIPSGFSSESESFVVASGLFPNSCYAWREASVKHTSPMSHEISASASVKQGMCLMVLVPFSKEIRLGKLSVGTHSVKLMNGDGTYIEKHINIEE